MFNALWFGILVGVVLGNFAPEWVKIVAFVIALVLSDLKYEVSRNVHKVTNFHSVHNVHFTVPPELIGLVGVGFGLWAWHYARKRGLQHLGEAELRTRWSNARASSKWGW
jgi:hypothetical protein